jgi:hypothetical protein
MLPLLQMLLKTMVSFQTMELLFRQPPVVGQHRPNGVISSSNIVQNNDVISTSNSGVISTSGVASWTGKQHSPS